MGCRPMASALKKQQKNSELVIDLPPGYVRQVGPCESFAMLSARQLANNLLTIV